MKKERNISITGQPESLKNIRVEKKFLPSIFFNRLKNTVTSLSFPWYFLKQTVFYEYVEQDKHFMFSHTLFNFDGNHAPSNWFKDFEPIIYFLNDKIKLKKLLRMKLNLYTNQNKAVKHVDHIDIMDENKDHPDPNVTVSILNFTTCNGGTIIKGKKYLSSENELLIFDNTIKHSGVVQTDTQTRVVLNIATK